jgi:integrase
MQPSIAVGENIKFIQKQLGHASLTTTMDTYGHLLPEASREFGSRLDSFLFDVNVVPFPEQNSSPDVPERVDNVWTV